MAKHPARKHLSPSEQRREDEVKGFYVHLILYLLINLIMFVYLYIKGQNLTLLYLLVGGWGVGIIVHALSVFGILKYLHKEFKI